MDEPKEVDRFVRGLRSRRILAWKPGDVEYERSVATNNLLFRFSRPQCVVEPQTAAHVQTIIKEAKLRNIGVTIKCGGHSYAGHSTAFNGVSLDLRKMNNVELDIESKTVTVDAGCQWAHVYKTLVNGRYDGYVINGGRCPAVGVSGFILGGGIGPFTRRLGMGSDSLLEATVVTADGDLVTVKKSNDRSAKKDQLFWALCGAGGGNFGVLVSMKLEVQQLRNKDGIVVAGRYTWLPRTLAVPEIVATMTDFYMAEWPEQMTIDSTWVCDLRQDNSGIRFISYFDGNKEEFDKVIDKHISQPPIAHQLKRRSLPEKSTRFFHESLVAQWSEETVRAFPTNRTFTIFDSFCFANDKATITNAVRVVQELLSIFRALFQGEQVTLEISWIHSGGKAMKKGPKDSAFFWRGAMYHTYVSIEWVDKWMEKDMWDFLHEAEQKLRPYSLGGRAAFINFPVGAFPKEVHEVAYFGENWEELRHIKRIWDKDNFFNWSQGVQLPQTEDPASVFSRAMKVQYPSIAGRGLMPMEFSDNELVSEAIGADKPKRPLKRKRLESTMGEQLTDKIAGEQWEYFQTAVHKDPLEDLMMMEGCDIYVP